MLNGLTSQWTAHRSARRRIIDTERRIGMLTDTQPRWTTLSATECCIVELRGVSSRQPASQGRGRRGPTLNGFAGRCIVYSLHPSCIRSIRRFGIAKASSFRDTSSISFINPSISIPIDRPAPAAMPRSSQRHVVHGSEASQSVSRDRPASESVLRPN